MRNNSKIKYKHLITAVFLVTITVMFIFNIKETAANVITGVTEKTPGALAADLENVETGTYTYININGFYQGLMQRNYMYDVNESDELIRADGKYLVSVPSTYDTNSIRESATNLEETSDWLFRKGIPMLYVQGASKLSISDRNIMPGIDNTTYEKTNRFLRELEERNVSFADAREWIPVEDMSAFYKTDHHWKTETCLAISERICDLLNNEYSMELDENFYRGNSFTVKTYKKAFLGAEGRRTGILYAGLDDFTVIEPEYETDYSVEIHTKEKEVIRRKGNFEQSVMDRSKDPEDYSFEDSAYYIYWGGDYSSVHVDNEKNKKGKRLVVIKDSYGIPVTAMMAGAFSSMDIFDVRYYNEDKAFPQAILDCEPDAVVFIYGTGYLDKPDMFEVFP